MFNNTDSEPLLDPHEQDHTSALQTPRTAGGSKVVKFKDDVQVRIIAPQLRSNTTSREAGELHKKRNTKYKPTRKLL